jgi:hypothetical protein
MNEIYIIPQCIECDKIIRLIETKWVLKDSICWCQDCQKYVKLKNGLGIDTIYSSRGPKSFDILTKVPNPVNVVFPWSNITDLEKNYSA